MRTARNIFIALLAVADLTICLLTMPMTMVGVLAKYWPFGPSTWYDMYYFLPIVSPSPQFSDFESYLSDRFIILHKSRGGVQAFSTAATQNWFLKPHQRPPKGSDLKR